MKDLRPIYYHEAKDRLIGNRLNVYDALRNYGPLTGTELAARMGWPVTSVRPRLCELREMRFAETTGTRRDGEHEFRALSHEEARCIIQAEQQAQVMDTVFAQIVQPVARNEKQLSLL